MALESAKEPRQYLCGSAPMSGGCQGAKKAARGICEGASSYQEMMRVRALLLVSHKKGFEGSGVRGQGLVIGHFYHSNCYIPTQVLKKEKGEG